MNVFIAVAALLTLLVLAWLLRPLLRQRPDTGSGITSASLNAALHRDQLQALQADLARGVITQQDFETTRDELQLRLLDDTESFVPQQPAVGSKPSFWTARRTAAVLGVSTPLLAVALYLQLGSPALLDPTAMAQNGPGGGQVSEQQIRDMIDQMAEKQNATPDNLKGWAMLARSYKLTGRLEEAKAAFEKAGSYVRTDPDVLLDYAALLGNLAGNRLDGEPSAKMIEDALQMVPDHPTGLMLSGIGAYQRGDFATAVRQWEKLLGMMDPSTEDAQQMRNNIADARSQGNLPPADSSKLPPVPQGAAAGGMTPEMINQMVERLANRLKDNPGDHAGWARLANAYRVQGKLDDAAAAYAKTGPLLDSDANLLTQYADLLAMRAKGDFKGQPLVLINKALSLDPKHPNALMMAGQAAFQAGEDAQAIRHWETVLGVLPAGSEDARQVQAEIADARARLGAASKP